MISCSIDRQINIIAAVARNKAIGYQNKLIYWLPNDLKRFKALTTGHTIIMGRNTFLSLPKGALPNRRNVVLSTTQTVFPGCECFSSLHDALQSCSVDEDIYIIGGAKLYNEAIHRIVIFHVQRIVQLRRANLFYFYTFLHGLFRF